MTRINPKSFRLRHKSTLSQWGKGLGLHIPSEAVRRLQLKAGEEVSLEVAEGRITIVPKGRKSWTEAEMLEGVTPGVVEEGTDSDEVEWGGPVGKELW